MKTGPGRNTFWESLQWNGFDNEHAQRNKIMNAVCVEGRNSYLQLGSVSLREAYVTYNQQVSN